jgi:hypothetical protein
VCIGSLVIKNIDARKYDGLAQPLDITVDVEDSFGNKQSGVLVQVVASYGLRTWTGILPETSNTGRYEVCDVGAFDGTDGGGVTINITLIKAPLCTTMGAGTAREGSICDAIP